LPVFIIKFDLLNTFQGFQGFQEWSSDGVISTISLARSAQKDMYNPILDLDAAISEEAILNLDDSLIAFNWGWTFEKGIQDSSDLVLRSSYPTLYAHIPDWSIRQGRLLIRKEYGDLFPQGGIGNRGGA